MADSEQGGKAEGVVDRPPLQHNPHDDTHLPLSSRDVTPLAALQVCSINLDAACGFWEKQKRRDYLASWMNPGPERCRSVVDAPPKVVEPLHADRLGIDIDCSGMI